MTARGNVFDLAVRGADAHGERRGGARAGARPVHPLTRDTDHLDAEAHPRRDLVDLGQRRDVLLDQLGAARGALRIGKLPPAPFQQATGCRIHEVLPR
jgi:hypothetical protein